MRGLACLLVALAMPVAAQDLIPPASEGPRRLSGPRTGLTLLPPRAVDAANLATNGQFGSVPVITQLGWQVETRIFQLEGGLTGVTETVMLVGGLDRGLVIPSVTFLTGLRLASGVESGIGPNLIVNPNIGAAEDVGDASTYAQVGLALAAGFSPHIDDVNLPVNVAVVLGRRGPRVSLLIGFNVSTHRY